MPNWAKRKIDSGGKCKENQKEKTLLRPAYLNIGMSKKKEIALKKKISTKRLDNTRLVQAVVSHSGPCRLRRNLRRGPGKKN